MTDPGLDILCFHTVHNTISAKRNGMLLTLSEETEIIISI